MDRADAQRLSPEFVMTPVGSSGDTSGVRGAYNAINWAVRAQEFEHQQRSGGIRAERLAMGALGSTPENRVPTAMAQPVLERCLLNGPKRRYQCRRESIFSLCAICEIKPGHWPMI